MRRKLILKHAIERKTKQGIKVTERRGRRRKQLWDDLKEMREYCKQKEGTLDRTLLRARFGRIY